MSKLLTITETTDIILKFVKDDRRNQAVLLNGEWGCGKTYFIKEKLIPEIGTDKYQIFQISLYGISEIEKIQDMIYVQWLEKVVGDKTENWGMVGNVLTKGIGMFGKGMIQLIESKTGTEGSVSEAAKNMLEKNMGKNKKPILIFDDIERSRLDMVELMGFLNNLSENNGYKLILVANEQEINRCMDEDDISRALKYVVALNDKLKKPGSGSENRIDRDELQKISDHYFERQSAYERTREKLIGLTVPYCVSIAEVFDEIVSEYIIDASAKEIVQANKGEIIDLFEREQHRNLRTLIAACIAIEDILSSIDQEKILEKEIFKDEIKTIVLYTAYSAMRRTDGIGEYHWSQGTRYGRVDDSLSVIKLYHVYGYAFVDEYWKTQCIDTETVSADIQDVINEKTAIRKSHEENEEYRSLALNRLIEWHLLSKDEEVKQLVQKMKTELEQKKYHPQDFKDIIVTLMRMNNPNFGMNPDKITEPGNVLFDSTDSGRFAGMSVVEQEAGHHCYSDWEEFAISEFVDLMLKYFDDEQFTMTKDMIKVFSKDKQFVYNYRQLTAPLLERIEKEEINKITSDEMIADKRWDDEFEKFCLEKRDNFLNQGRFLSLFPYDKLTSNFITAIPMEIHSFCDAVRKVYSFSDLRGIYSADYEMVKRVSDYISENMDGVLNEDKSRVKEIALRRLKSDMNEYEGLLRGGEA